MGMFGEEIFGHMDQTAKNQLAKSDAPKDEIKAAEPPPSIAFDRNNSPSKMKDRNAQDSGLILAKIALKAAGVVGTAAAIVLSSGGGDNAYSQEGLHVEPTVSHVHKFESGVSYGSKNETGISGQQKQEQARIRLDSSQIKSILNEVSITLKDDATDSVPLILKAFEDEGITWPPVIGFGIANAEHEAWFDYEKREIDGDSQAEIYGYSGKMPGLGLIQITGKKNLETYSKYLSERFPERYKGLDLVKNPDKALEPDISAAILAGFIKNEKNEKGESIADMVMQGRYEEARKKVVGNYLPTDDKNIEVTKNIIKRSKEFEKAFMTDLYNAQISAQLDRLRAQGRN